MTVPCFPALGRGVVAALAAAMTRPSISRNIESLLILMAWEPEMGAYAGRFPQTACDTNRALSQVRGSPADSLRPSQTGRSCLGVKGSRVQIPPSRLSFHS